MKPQGSSINKEKLSECGHLELKDFGLASLILMCFKFCLRLSNHINYVKKVPFWGFCSSLHLAVQIHFFSVHV
jgi:hypothetical protein